MQRKKRYKIIIADETRLQELWSIRLTTLRAIFLSITIFVVALTLSAFLIVLTPLSSLLPGYMKKNQRADSIEVLLKLDSLQNEYNRNQAYLNSIALIFDTDRVSNDSATLVQQESEIINDTLVSTTSEEREFIKMMQEREKYNTSILAPLAADGLLFTSPCPGSVLSEESLNNPISKVIVPRGSGICSITDGTIVDTYFNTTESTYTIVIQHPKGFLSKYSGIGQPIVNKGKNVITGERIALSSLANGRQINSMYLEMWRNGLSLIPSQYIAPSLSQRESNDTNKATNATSQQ